MPLALWAWQFIANDYRRFIGNCCKLLEMEVEMESESRMGVEVEVELEMETEDGKFH